MKDLGIEEKIELIKNLTRKHGITAYEIGENTNISDVTVHNILTDKSNPRLKTVNIILNYIESRIVATEVPGHKKNGDAINVLREPREAYDLKHGLQRLEMIITNGNTLLSTGISELLLDTDEILDLQQKHNEVLERLSNIIEDRRNRRAKQNS